MRQAAARSAAQVQNAPRKTSGRRGPESPTVFLKISSKGGAQCHIGVGHRDREAEIGQRRDAEMGVADAAGRDARKCWRSGSTLMAIPWKVAIAGCGYRLRRSCLPRSRRRDRALFRPAHPDADAVLAPFAPHVEGRERRDDPRFEGGDEGARRAAGFSDRA